MPLVVGIYAPNAPNLIDPEIFGGVGTDTVRALRRLEVAARYRPDAVVVASPHWVSPQEFLVEESPSLKQIFDFSGFPRRLYEVRYAPPGDPALARALVDEGRARGLPVRGSRGWGLDHGAWAPLLHLFPGAETPTVPLSMTPRTADDHLAWGAAIGAACAASPRRIAFVATGSITHRLDRFGRDPAARWPEGEALEREVVDLLLARRYGDVARFDPAKWARLAPEGDLAPLFELVGALGPAFVPRLVATGQAFGAAGMTILEFTPPDAGAAVQPGRDVSP